MKSAQQTYVILLILAVTSLFAITIIGLIIYCKFIECIISSFIASSKTKNNENFNLQQTDDTEIINRSCFAAKQRLAMERN